MTYEEDEEVEDLTASRISVKTLEEYKIKVYSISYLIFIASLLGRRIGSSLILCYSHSSLCHGALSLIPWDFDLMPPQEQGPPLSAFSASFVDFETKS